MSEERETTDRYPLGAGERSSEPWQLQLKCRIGSSPRRNQKRIASPEEDALVGFQRRQQTADYWHNIGCARGVTAVGKPPRTRKKADRVEETTPHPQPGEAFEKRGDTQRKDP